MNRCRVYTEPYSTSKGLDFAWVHGRMDDRTLYLDHFGILLCRPGSTSMGQREVEGRPARRLWRRLPIDVYSRCEVLEAECFDERQSSLPVLSLW